MDIFNVDKSDAMRFSYLSQVLICLYGARFSYVAVTNLRKYEEVTKKAAEWSQVVQDHLTKTRTTQATAASCLFLSFISSAVTLGAARYDKVPEWVPKVLGPAMLVVVLAMRRYVKNYWTPYKTPDGKDVSGRVPLPYMEDYNEAELMTERMLEVMSYLEYSWVMTSAFAHMGWKL